MASTYRYMTVTDGDEIKRWRWSTADYPDVSMFIMQTYGSKPVSYAFSADDEELPGVNRVNYLAPGTSCSKVRVELNRVNSELASPMDYLKNFVFNEAILENEIIDGTYSTFDTTLTQKDMSELCSDPIPYMSADQEPDEESFIVRVWYNAELIWSADAE
jgi:hypothetical protein